MTSICFDTAFLIDFLRGNKQAYSYYMKTRGKSVVFATTSINIFELFRGIEKRGRKSQDEQAARKLLSRLIIWNLDYDSAEYASTIFTKLERKGTPIPINDCFMAAIAVRNGCTQIVSEDRHFERIEQITMEKYLE
ncbi:MAG: PIN domain-containing protein [Candidatus Lokiarchaeota archaeon]|nr:PIN domain-containing protein [Candidatus Lokiarchaeota archaeon]